MTDKLKTALDDLQHVIWDGCDNAEQTALTIQLALKACQEMQWKPIESAPRDGVRVSIQEPSYNKKFTVQSIAYFVKKHTLEDYTGEMDIEFMDDHNGTYYWPEGWYSADNGNDDLVIKCSPTAWRPLQSKYLDELTKMMEG